MACLRATVRCTAGILDQKTDAEWSGKNRSFFGGVEHLGEHSIQHQKLIDGKKHFCVWSFCWPILFEVVTTATSKQLHVEAVTTATSKKTC